MKRILLILATCLCMAAVHGQIPMPMWVLTKALEAQCGVAEYTTEKFDFKRLPTTRKIADYLWLRDTASFKKYLYKVDICDGQGVVAQLGFQDSVQVSPMADTALFVSARNAFLEVSLNKYLAPDAPEEEIARTVGELQHMRPSLEELVSQDEIGLLPAHQNGICYGLQYLFARNGIDASPIFGWDTIVRSDNDGVKELIGRCCDRVQVQKIGKDIERFARKAKFSEDYMYVCEGSDDQRRAAVVFFFCDGKFWSKVGMSQYTTYDSVISVWRHDKKATAVVAYKLKDSFLR